jgi:hypothetical protein
MAYKIELFNLLIPLWLLYLVYYSIIFMFALSIYLSILSNLFIHLSIALQHPFVGLWPLFFQFLDFYTFGWAGDQPVARPLPAHRTAQTKNKRTQTSMTQVEFEPTIAVFERAKKVYDLDRAATVIVQSLPFPELPLQCDVIGQTSKPSHDPIPLSLSSAR